jgi:hypothetical protein
MNMSSSFEGDDGGEEEEEWAKGVVNMEEKREQSCTH